MCIYLKAKDKYFCSCIQLLYKGLGTHSSVAVSYRFVKTKLKFLLARGGVGNIPSLRG